MGLIALICAIIVVLAVPREVWAVLLYFAFIVSVAFIGFTAFIFWIVS